MSNQNVELIRGAYEAYARGDLAAMLQVLDLELEWTYLDPAWRILSHRSATAATSSSPRRSARPERGLRAQLEEIVEHGDRVMVVVRTPGIDAYRVRQADDRNYNVFTVRDGRIVAMRDCHDRQEALRFTGIQ
jgi:ketosteroid isomerase-like protein